MKFKPWKYFVGISLVSLCLLFSSCQNKSTPPTGGGEGGGLLGGGPDDNLNSVLNSGGGGYGGSGPAGAVTPADKTAVDNLIQKTNDPLIKPSTADWQLPAELQNQINQMLAAQKNGQDVSAVKWQIAGTLLQECAKKAVKFGPVPGQPLLGGWQGPGDTKGNCKVAFEVQGPGANQVYEVSGGAKGQLGANPDGRFQLSGNPFSGSGADTGFQGKPLSGIGTLTNPQGISTKYGTQPCTTNVQLITPKSPIPANYASAIKTVGACYRQALTLLSMDKIFEKMDPSMAQALQQNILR